MTIYQLASSLSLSASTVSLALKGDPRIAEATRKRVLDYAAEAGYKVNVQARNLRLGRSGLVALMLPDVASGFWSGVIASLEEGLGPDFKLMICNSRGSLERESAILDELQARRVDGLVTLPADNAKTEKLSAFAKQGVPTVLFDRNEDPAFSYVKGDDFSASRKALRLLAESGRKRVAFLNIPIEKSNSGVKDRLRGFLSEAMALEIEGSCRAFTLTREGESLLSGEFFDEIASFDAAICLNAEVYARLLRTLRPLGARVPEDLACFSWDDPAMFKFLDPSPSCALIPIAAMGAGAASILKGFHEGDKEPKRLLLEEPFIFRESFPAPESVKKAGENAAVQD